MLLIAQLPLLEQLLVDGLTPYPILDWPHFLSRCSTALQNLENLGLWGSCDPEDDKPVKNTLQILDILPNLECLQLAHISAQGHHHNSEDILPSKKLRDVHIVGSAIRHRLLKKITASQNILTFLHVPGGSQINVNEDAVSSETQITTYLESLKYSLRKLTLYPTVHNLPLCEYFRLLQDLKLTVPAFHE